MQLIRMMNVDKPMLLIGATFGDAELELEVLKVRLCGICAPVPRMIVMTC